MANTADQPAAVKLQLAVSADGRTLFDGLIADNANGIVDQPRLPRFKIPWAGG